jgi:hypothetical protein
VTIDTTQGVKTVRNASGVSLYGSLTSDSTLWSLAVGTNAIVVQLDGASTASAVQLSYRRRWLAV